MKESTRAYLYRIFLAAAALAVGYGLVADEQAVLWVAVGSAVLGNGLAAKNTSVKRDEGGAVNLSPLVTGLIVVALVLLILWLVGHPVKVG